MQTPSSAWNQANNRLNCSTAYTTHAFAVCIHHSNITRCTSLGCVCSDLARGETLPHLSKPIRLHSHVSASNHNCAVPFGCSNTSASNVNVWCWKISPAVRQTMRCANSSGEHQECCYTSSIACCTTSIECVVPCFLLATKHTCQVLTS